MKGHFRDKIAVPCFNLLSNALWDTKTKMLNFKHKNGCKDH